MQRDISKSQLKQLGLQLLAACTEHNITPQYTKQIFQFASHLDKSCKQQFLSQEIIKINTSNNICLQIMPLIQKRLLRINKLKKLIELQNSIQSNISHDILYNIREYTLKIIEKLIKFQQHHKKQRYKVCKMKYIPKIIKKLGNDVQFLRYTTLQKIMELSMKKDPLFIYLILNPKDCKNDIEQKLILISNELKHRLIKSNEYLNKYNQGYISSGQQLPEQKLPSNQKLYTKQKQDSPINAQISENQFIKQQTIQNSIKTRKVSLPNVNKRENKAINMKSCKQSYSNHHGSKSQKTQALMHNILLKHKKQSITKTSTGNIRNISNFNRQYQQLPMKQKQKQYSKKSQKQLLEIKQSIDKKEIREKRFKTLKNKYENSSLSNYLIEKQLKKDYSYESNLNLIAKLKFKQKNLSKSCNRQYTDNQSNQYSKQFINVQQQSHHLKIVNQFTPKNHKNYSQNIYQNPYNNAQQQDIQMLKRYQTLPQTRQINILNKANRKKQQFLINQSQYQYKQPQQKQFSIMNTLEDKYNKKQPVLQHCYNKLKILQKPKRSKQEYNYKEHIISIDKRQFLALEQSSIQKNVPKQLSLININKFQKSPAQQQNKIISQINSPQIQSKSNQVQPAKIKLNVKSHSLTYTQLFQFLHPFYPTQRKIFTDFFNGYYKNRHLSFYTCKYNGQILAFFLVHTNFIANKRKNQIILFKLTNQQYKVKQDKIFSSCLKYIFEVDPADQILFQNYLPLSEPNTIKNIKNSQFFISILQSFIKDPDFSKEALLFSRKYLKCDKKQQHIGILKSSLHVITHSKNITQNNNKFLYISKNFEQHLNKHKISITRDTDKSKINIKQPMPKNFVNTLQNNRQIIFSYSNFFEIQQFSLLRYCSRNNLLYVSIQPPYSYYTEYGQCGFLLIKARNQGFFYIIMDTIFQQSDQNALQIYLDQIQGRKITQAFNSPLLPHKNIITVPFFNIQIQMKMSETQIYNFQFGCQWKSFLHGTMKYEEKQIRTEFILPMFGGLIKLNEQNELNYLFLCKIQQ